MTKARLHPALLEFRGAMGDMVFKRRGNKIYVSMKPKKGMKKASKAQLAWRKVFRKAVYYAKSAMADEATRVFYEAIAKEKGREARPLCVADYLNAPTVEELDVSKYEGNVGDRILIVTYDDVGVVEVNVTLTNNDGTTIETGPAVEQGANSGNWEYIATVAVAPDTDIVIKAEVRDRPGNQVVASASLMVGTKR